MKTRAPFCLLGALLAFAMPGHATGHSFMPDLAKINDGKTWQLFNAQANPVSQDGKSAVQLTVKKAPPQHGSNVGVAYVKGLAFHEGVIEVDLKGQNKAQSSFLGVAFHGTDNKNFEAVYFRPFYFKAENVMERAHAAQYIAWPLYPWDKLRQDKPGIYENFVTPTPNPAKWFHVRIDIEAKVVRVFVNNAKVPSLNVKRLGDHNSGQVGLWCDVANGTYANLKITPSR